jgi:hypothetical protein
MQRCVPALLAGWMLAAWGCASVGPGPHGPAETGSRNLQGTLTDGVYHATDASFSVSSPYEPGSTAYADMEIKELYSPEDAYVSFAPDGGRDVYRVDVSRAHTPAKMGVPLEAVAPILVRVFADQLESIYGTALVEQRHAQVRVGGHPAEFWAYSQRIPADKLADSAHGRDVFETDYVYVVDGGAQVATLWAEIPEPCERCGKGPESDLLVPYARADRFVRSFAFGPGPAPAP